MHTYIRANYTQSHTQTHTAARVTAEAEARVSDSQTRPLHAKKGGMARLWREVCMCVCVCVRVCAHV